MTHQLRELLTRIPASPETDELQDLLEAMTKAHSAEVASLNLKVYHANLLLLPFSNETIAAEGGFDLDNVIRLRANLQTP